jgi:hypothetical protein
MASTLFSPPGISMASSSTGTRPTQKLETLLQLLPEWQHETAKAQFLDYLYDLYDRGNAPLGLRGTYTGLWEQYQRDLACIDRLSLYLNR